MKMHSTFALWSSLNTKRNMETVRFQLVLQGTYSNSCMVTVMYCDYKHFNVSLTLAVDRCSSQTWFLGEDTKTRAQEVSR